MSCFFSPSQDSFYCTELHGDSIPVDSIPISHDEHKVLYQAFASGKRIVVGEDGSLVIEQNSLSVDERRLVVWNSVKDNRRIVMESGVIHNGHIYQTREVDAFNIRGILDAYATGGLTGTTQYITADNQVVQLSQLDFQAIHNKSVSLYVASDARAQALRSLINASDNPESIDINTGWPTVPYSG